MAELVFFRRGEEVLRFSLERDRVVLGRGEQSDVALPDPEVSRQQAALTFQSGTWRLTDLSGNGTLVLGERVTEAALADGADITLGQWRAVFRERGGNAALEQATRISGTRTVRRPGTEGSEEKEAKPEELHLRLRVRHGGQESTRPMPPAGLSVGKAPDNDVVLDDAHLSAHHLRLLPRHGRVLVLDQRSTNGTWLNDVRVVEAEAPLFAPIHAGGVELSVEPDTEAPSSTGRPYLGLIGDGRAMRELAELIERVAPSSAAVAVLGESGTGKELVSRGVHARSQRADKPFIPVNCAAISKELIESELFGHEKGAFTGAMNARKGAFEEADGGTLFLDEIGELALDLQAKLLRALESGEIKRVGASKPEKVDVRIVTATHRDLLAEAKAGRFREDLYYRLCVVPLHLPPLRARPKDIPALAEHFLKMFAPRGQEVKLTPGAVERLQAHHWPGNVRELRNVLHRALLLRRGVAIDAADITFDSEVNREVGVPVPELASGQTLEQMLEKVERQIVESALRRFNNNRERVAKELGVARSTLFKRLKDWGLTRQDEAES